MRAELIHTLRRMRGQIIGWGIGIALYGLLMASFFDTLVNIEGLTQILESYPPELMAFFGNVTAITTPAGYLDTYFFSYMTLIIGIFAIGACANLLSGDEEQGVLDLVLAYPISRARLFWGRLLGFVIALGGVLGAAWLSWLIPSGNSGLNLSWIELLQSFLPLFAELLLFGALALFFSMILPAARLAGWLSGALLVGNFLLLGLANINNDLEPFIRYSPLKYYQGGDAIHGLNWEWLAGLLAASGVFILAAWLIFQRRDIRVGGERGWEWGELRRRLRPRRAS